MDYTAITNLIGHPHAQIGPLSLFDTVLFAIKDIISLIGTLVILTGAMVSIYHYTLGRYFKRQPSIERIRLELGQAIALGLEFIVAADIIETSTAPDYYTVGILAIVVGIRTFLNYFLNKEIISLKK